MHLAEATCTDGPDICDASCLGSTGHATIQHGSRKTGVIQCLVCAQQPPLVGGCRVHSSAFDQNHAGHCL